MYQRIFFLILLTWVVLASCQSQKIEPVLEKAAMIMEDYPDSALIILEELQNPQGLKKSEYCQYYLLYIQAKDKCYKNITSDTLIFDIQKYFVCKNDVERAAVASFYSGRVLQENKKYEDALQTYLNADDYLQQSKNDNLKGLFQAAIGEIYYHQLLTDESIAHVKMALDYFKSSEKYRNEIMAYRFIGNAYLMQKQIDSAFVYLSKALDQADKYKLKGEKINTRIGLGIAYRQIENWNKSKNLFRQAWSLATDSLDKARIASNFIDLFESEAKNDSVKYYLKVAEKYMPQKTNNSLAANIYKRWSAFEERNSNFKEALDKYKIYNKHLAAIITDNKNSAVMEIEKKYKFQQIENSNKKLIIDRQRILLLSIGLLITLIILIVLFVSRSSKNKKMLEDAEYKICQLQEMAKSFNQKENSFRNVLIRHFDILKKAAVLEGFLKEEEIKTGKNLLRKFNDIVYGQKELDWNILYNSLNEASNGLLDQLKSKFPVLEESEFRICCLVFIECNNTEIAIILNYSINTIQVKKSIIRKKLGIKTFGDIRDFLIM